MAKEDMQSEAQVSDVQDAADVIASRLSSVHVSEKSNVGDDSVPDKEPSEGDAILDDSEEVNGSDDDESDDQELESQDGEEIVLESIDDVASLVGVSSDDVLSKVMVNVEDGDVDEKVSLSDLIKGYSAYKKQSSVLGEKLSSIDKEFENNRAEIATRIANSSIVINKMEEQLKSEYQSVDWNSLYESDPGEFSAMHIRFQQRLSEIDNMKGVVANEFSKIKDEMSKKTVENTRENIKREFDYLLSKIPEWKDSAVVLKEQKEISAFLKERYGYSDNDINEVRSAKFVLMARDLLKSKSMNEKMDIAKKKVSNVPNTIKPGTKERTGREVKGREKEEMRQAIRSGDFDRIGAAIAAKL